MVGLMILIPVVVIAIVWARGIAYMHENHPDYKGDDFLNWNKDDKNN
jgi:hypothetical protein